MSRFTNQKPFLVTEKELQAWAKIKNWHCSLCGEDFKLGHTARWVFGGPQKFRNFFVCSNCDCENVIDKAIESYNLAVKMAKQWEIYGPDWEKEAREYERVIEERDEFFKPFF